MWWLVRCAPRSGGGGPSRSVDHLRRRACSPLRRGRSPGQGRGRWYHLVLPAQAGVVPISEHLIHVNKSAPRSGGGGPVSFKRFGILKLCSPLRRGWSRGHWGLLVSLWVLPAQAGVVPIRCTRNRLRRRAPRSGGGGPIADVVEGGAKWCSPLRRGWSHFPRLGEGGPAVLPAQAGVVPTASFGCSPPTSAPRSGGGGPTGRAHRRRYLRCSPLRRGWSLDHEHRLGQRGVLPAQAGVVPFPMAASRSKRCAPRSGGGGPCYER